MSQDLAVYAASEKPPSMKKILDEMRKRKVPVSWKPTFKAAAGKPAEWKVGSLSSAGAAGPADTIGASWESLEDYMRDEALGHPAASPHLERLRNARILFQLSLPDSAGPEGRRRLAHLVEVVAGREGGVGY